MTGAVELLVSVLAITHENVVSMNRFSACLCQTCGCESGMGADNVRGAEGAALRGDSFGIVVGLISCARSARCAGCASNPSACKIGISWIRCASSAANCARARIGTGLSVKCESADFANMVTDRLSGSAGASPSRVWLCPFGLAARRLKKSAGRRFACADGFGLNDLMELLTTDYADNTDETDCY